MQASRTSLLVVRRIHGPAEQRLVTMGYAGSEWRLKEKPPIQISLDGKKIGTIWPPKWSTDFFEAALEDSTKKEERSQFEIQAGHHDLMVHVTWSSALLYMAFTGVTPGIQSFDSAPGETVTFLCQYTPATPSGYKIRLLREQSPQQKEQLPSEQQAIGPSVPKPQPSKESPSSAQSLPFVNRDDYSLLSTLTGHTEYVESVAFRSDGQTLASGSRDKTIKIWGKNR